MAPNRSGPDRASIAKQALEPFLKYFRVPPAIALVVNCSLAIAATLGLLAYNLALPINIILGALIVAFHFQYMAKLQAAVTKPETYAYGLIINYELAAIAYFLPLGELTNLFMLYFGYMFFTNILGFWIYNNEKTPTDWFMEKITR